MQLEKQVENPDHERVRIVEGKNLKPVELQKKIDDVSVRWFLVHPASKTHWTTHIGASLLCRHSALVLPPIICHFKNIVLQWVRSTSAKTKGLD